MKKLLLITTLLMVNVACFSQKYMTRTGKISFYSATPLEKIEALNNEVAAIMDTKTGEILFQVPVKSFKFERALMQEHFNENYMESDKYPKAVYKGTVVNIASINLSKDGNYEVKTTGKLTIHGTTQDVTIPGTITVKNGIITINTKFMVKPPDYKIKIPGLVAGKIAEQIEVTVNTILKSTN